MSEQEQIAGPRPAPGAGILVRALVGALAGAATGLLASAYIYYLREVTGWFILALIGVSVVICVGLAVTLGNASLGGRAGQAIMGGVLGLLLGAGLGGFAYPAVRRTLAGHERLKSGDHIYGFLVGTPLGALSGIVGGLCVGALRSRGRNRTWRA